MKLINELSKNIHQEFGWNKARVDCFSKTLIALLKVQTVNLTKIARALKDKTKQSSRYRRLQRFFSRCNIQYDDIARFLMDLFFSPNEPVCLTMDRTTWKWGKQSINILMLAVIYQGCAIPVYWVLLDKPGSSHAEERIHLMQTFINTFGKKRIKRILGDREFIGDRWFQWLKKKEISFIFRIKNNTITTNQKGQSVDIDALFYGLKPGEKRILKGQRKLWKQHQVYLSGLRLAKGDLLIVASNQSSEKSIEDYGKRWEIETLFSCLKSRGFHFEDTHMTHPERVKKLLICLSIGFCWAHKTGEWRHTIEPIKIKTHGRRQFSFFRYGLDYLADIIFSLSYRYSKQLKYSIQLLFNSPSPRNDSSIDLVFK